MIILADIVVFLSIFFGLACIVGIYKGIKEYKNYFKEPKIIWFYSITDLELLSFHNALMDSIEEVIGRIKDSNAEFKANDQDETFDINIYNFYSGSIMIHKSFYLFNMMISPEDYITSLIIDPKTNSAFQINTKILNEINNTISSDNFKTIDDLRKYVDEVNDGCIGDVYLLKKFTKQLNKYKNEYVIDNIIATNQSIVEIDILNRSYLDHVLKNKVEKSIEEKPAE